MKLRFVLAKMGGTMLQPGASLERTLPCYSEPFRRMECVDLKKGFAVRNALEV